MNSPANNGGSQLSVILYSHNVQTSVEMRAAVGVHKNKYQCSVRRGNLRKSEQMCGDMT